MAETTAPNDPLELAAIGPAEVCADVERAVRAYLPHLLPDDLDVPETWEQLPSMDAMLSASTPALAFTSPGLAEEPNRVSRGQQFDAVWTVVVSVWVRGADGTHESTTSTCRRYTKALRVAVLAWAARNGRNWTWRSEAYDALPMAEYAATIQAGMVSFDVPVSGAVDLAALPELPDDVDLPLVRHTYVTATGVPGKPPRET